MTKYLTLNVANIERTETEHTYIIESTQIIESAYIIESTYII